ncbi:ABC transporter substrate-binding protein [Actinomadura sp. KC06]|uniref:ABC transporter substrate-binding protein n=1 Tax=Actinomadura sp. KC06 TaxID=2530369 RepID=UPI0014054E4D|nr:ABC transporter substrate-binding protein [Actinomadura sp. KC06]
MTDEVTPLRAGDPSRLGAYRLTGLLGEGGQGTVYLGEDEPGHRVAVKLLHARFSGDPKARARFAAEVAVAKRVSAFCTARVLDSDVEGDRPYIVSEYIDGPPLSQVLSAEGPRRGTDLDRLAIGTMTALAAIHQAGVVHRDFKPANVLLAPDGPRVIDFGIARALDATGTMSSTAVGTPAYMAPEQISGARVGPAADVFAWGATMVHAATARPAFGHDSIPAVMHRILNLPPDLGDLHAPLRQIVADCLSKDPALRPESQRVLAHLLNLAGSLPQPGARQDAPGDDSVILTQGAATAATESARLRIVQTPPAQTPQPQTPQPQTPQPQTPQPQTPPAQTPPPQTPSMAPPGGAWPPPAPPPPAPPPGGQGYAATWPSSAAPDMGTDVPRPPGRRGRRGMGVLASAGGAALVALVVAGTAIAVQLAGDGDPDPTTTSAGGRTGGTFQMAMRGVGTSADEIDPSHAFSGAERFLTKQLFTGLTELAPDGTPRNRLATQITPDASCRQWKIQIKDGTRFSDGRPVDAQAFARGWARSAATSAGGGAYLMTDIVGFAAVSSGKAETLSGVKVVSGTLLDVALTSPNCDFPARLAEPAFMPVPEDAGRPENKAYNIRPVGNGPFSLQDYREDSRVTLVRNDAWAFGKTKFDAVDVRLSDEPGLGRTAYAAGEVDWYTVGTDQVASAPKNELVTRPSPFTRMLVPITARPPMHSKDARLAVSYAIDREKLVALAGGSYKRAHGIVPAGVPGFGGPGACPSCDGTDPAKAKELAARAGLKPGTEMRFYYRASTADEKLVEVVRHSLESVLGWKIDARAIPLSEYERFRKELVKDDACGLAFFSWGPDYPSAYSMLWPLLGGTVVATGTNNYYNLSGWKNGNFDTLISSALRTQPASTRANLFRQAEKLALDDMALIPLVNTGSAAVRRGGMFVGLEMDYDGDPTVATAALK